MQDQKNFRICKCGKVMRYKIRHEIIADPLLFLFHTLKCMDRKIWNFWKHTPELFRLVTYKEERKMLASQ